MLAFKVHSASMAADPPLLDVLRAATADHHASLEQRLDLNTRAWSHGRYAAFLRGTLAVVGPAAGVIQQQLGSRFDLSMGVGAPDARLRQDLDALGEPGVANAEVPAITTLGGAYGAAYVLQGSLLGGQIIAATLVKQIGLMPEQLTYLRPPVAVGPHWKTFIGALNAFGDTASSDDRRTAVSAAVEYFGAFATSFHREGLA